MADAHEEWFTTNFVKEGRHGYDKFKLEMRRAVLEAFHDFGLSLEEEDKEFTALDKVGGWIDMTIIHLKGGIWDVLKCNANSEHDWITLTGDPALQEYKDFFCKIGVLN